MMKLGLHVSWKEFAQTLYKEIEEDNIWNGAAALAYYLLLSIFPATIFLLSLLPFLPIANLDQSIMDLISQLLPQESASTFTSTIQEIVNNRKGGLLSFGLLLTFWAASNGMFAIMQQLNITYDVKEGRPFWKTRGTAILLTVLFGALIIGAFALIVFGGTLQGLVANFIGDSWIIQSAFAALRWGIIAMAILMGFAVTYYYGPDVEQDFRFISPGSVLGSILLVVASLGFKFYVDNFGSYNATYGSIGAVITLMLWLYILGLVVLIGSEINALVEHYSSEGKNKGEKQQPAA